LKSWEIQRKSGNYSTVRERCKLWEISEWFGLFHLQKCIHHLFGGMAVLKQQNWCIYYATYNFGELKKSSEFL